MFQRTALPHALHAFLCISMHMPALFTPGMAKTPSAKLRPQDQGAALCALCEFYHIVGIDSRPLGATLQRVTVHTSAIARASQVVRRRHDLLAYMEPIVSVCHTCAHLLSISGTFSSSHALDSLDHCRDQGWPAEVWCLTAKRRWTPKLQVRSGQIRSETKTREL